LSVVRSSAFAAEAVAAIHRSFSPTFQPAAVFAALWAGVCKHVAATLYGVGARLDKSPELLFVLRGVDAGDLVHVAAGELAQAAADEPVRPLGGQDLSEVFGIELAQAAALVAPRPGSRTRRCRGNGTRSAFMARSSGHLRA
jgi:hypothetical protein